MKNYIRACLTICISMLLSTAAFSQNQEERFNRIESAKIALITERLQLTPSQAEKFWPVYNEFQREKRSLRRKMVKGRYSSLENLSEAEARKILDQRQEIKKQELELDEKYMSLLIETTSAKQILALGEAESEFRRLLLRRLRTRKK